VLGFCVLTDLGAAFVMRQISFKAGLETFLLYFRAGYHNVYTEREVRNDSPFFVENTKCQ